MDAGVVGASFITRTLGWELAMSTRVDVLAFLFAGAVGVCFDLYPAIRASRMDPIVALRIE